MACNSTCGSCNRCTDYCTCKPIISNQECSKTISSKCVEYKPLGGNSNIQSYLGFGVQTKLETILETINSKLFNLTNITVPNSAKVLLNTPAIADLNFVLNKILEYIPTVVDTKVKVSTGDLSSGTLFDKIIVGECLNKTIITDVNGNQKLNVTLDFNCLSVKLNGNPNCVDSNWVDTGLFRCESNVSEKQQVSDCGNLRWVAGGTSCAETFIISSSNGTTVCGENVVLLATYPFRTASWYKNGNLFSTSSSVIADAGVYYAVSQGETSNTITIVNSGNCTSCVPVWTDIVTPSVIIFCGQTLNEMELVNTYDPCLMYIKQHNQCNSNTRWVIYTGSNSENAVNCPGCTQ